MRRRSRLPALLVAAAMLLSGATLRGTPVTPTAASQASPVCIPRAAPVQTGLTLVASTPMDSRLTDLAFTSKAAGTYVNANGTVHADILLPASYAKGTARRYPVLYLLHGHGGSYRDWAAHGVEKIIGALDVIVVMPEGGYDGYYTDWYGSDTDGHIPVPPPAFESFDTKELIPYIDSHYRTIANRRSRAIAGLSMGGFGAMSLAARHPDLFVAAGGFSGVVDSDLNFPFGNIFLEELQNKGDNKPADRCVWGDFATQDVIWRDHDPTEIARNLGGLSLFIACGNGTPGKYDDPAHPDVGGTLGEGVIFQMNVAFDAALTLNGQPHTTDFYGAGTHSWPYWEDDLRTFLPQMTAAFAHAPPAPPAIPFSFETAATDFGAWGWTFHATRAATQMTYLDSASRDGFVAAGSGKLAVVTAPLYSPRHVYNVSGATLAGDMKVVAGRDGRLRFDVDLGPAIPVQQDAFGPAVESAMFHATVHITAMRA